MANKPEILDLRAHSQLDTVGAQFDIRKQVLDGLNRPNGQRELPTLLLYDERGLRLYDDITTKAPEYYVFAAEEEILKTRVDDIVRTMHSHEGGLVPDEVVLELGAGALRKTSLILEGLSRLVSESPHCAPVTYYALDLERRELERTLKQIAMSETGTTLKGKVDAKGMCGTYEDGLKFVEDGGLHNRNAIDRISSSSRLFDMDKFHREPSPTSPTSNSSMDSDTVRTDFTAPSTPEPVQPPLHLLFLGSSLGNFPRNDARDFLRSLPLRPGSGDTLLLGLDHDNAKAKIEIAYNDVQGYTRKFIMNGLKAAGRVLGDETVFAEDKWEYVNFYNVEERCHEAYYKSKCEQTLRADSSGLDVTFLPDELLKIEVSIKYSYADALSMFTEGNLRVVQRWTDTADQYSLWLLERPPFMFPLLTSPRACTAAGNLVLKTKQYSTSPFGIPSLGDWESIWALWDFITQRMIPPSMMFQKPIQLRHICLFYLGHIPTFLDIHLSRLFQEPHTEPDYFKYIFERGIDPHVDDPTKCHSHSEVPQKDEDWPQMDAILDFQTRVRTRLLKIYDDVDSGKLPMTRKIGRVLFMTYEHEALHAETLLYMLLQRAGTGTIPPPGFTAPSWESLATSWNSAPEPATPIVTLGPATVTLGHDDLEVNDTNPQTMYDVQEHEFGWDNEHGKRDVQVNKFRVETRPITNGEFYEFYNGVGKGKVDLPASWVEVDGETRVRTMYGPVPIKIAKRWPVMASYNSLSTYASVKGGRIPTEPEVRLFYDKFASGYEGGANIGFRNWHPVPATAGGERAGGKGHNGGVWEWTSTVFDNYDGFVPSDLYPGYSMDFFDQCHQVVLGGSYATIPRIADRRSFRNWYQANYVYPWIGARIAYDA